MQGARIISSSIRTCAVLVQTSLLYSYKRTCSHAAESGPQVEGAGEAAVKLQVVHSTNFYFYFYYLIHLNE